MEDFYKYVEYCYKTFLILFPTYNFLEEDIKKENKTKLIIVVWKESILLERVKTEKRPLHLQHIHKSIGITPFGEELQLIIKREIFSFLPLLKMTWNFLLVTWLGVKVARKNKNKDEEDPGQCWQPVTKNITSWKILEIKVRT